MLPHQWRGKSEERWQYVKSLETSLQHKQKELAEADGMNEELRKWSLRESESCRVLADEKHKLETFEKRVSELNSEVGGLSAENEILRAEVKHHLNVKQLLEQNWTS